MTLVKQLSLLCLSCLQRVVKLHHLPLLLHQHQREEQQHNLQRLALLLM
jgi:hypothetical protein